MDGDEAVDGTVLDDEHERRIGVAAELAADLAPSLAALHDALARRLGVARDDLWQRQFEPESAPGYVVMR